MELNLGYVFDYSALLNRAHILWWEVTEAGVLGAWQHLVIGLFPLFGAAHGEQFLHMVLCYERGRNAMI